MNDFTSGKVRLSLYVPWKHVGEVEV